jgi:hypothetical protein
VQVQPAVAASTFGDRTGASGGNNNARCHERLHQKSDPYVAAQECRIVQVNTSGKNHASVYMLIDQNANGTTQTAQQEAEVIQSNATGDNHSLVTQIVKQTINGGTSTQTQEAHQSACVWQGGVLVATPTEECRTTDEQSSGSNFSQIHQQQDQSEKSRGAGTSFQHQNVGNLPQGMEDCDTEAPDYVSQPNMCANLEQHSTTGDAQSHFTQLSNQDMRTDSTSGQQVQGSFDNGLDGDADQDTPSPKAHHATLRKTQKQVAKSSGVAQEKWDPSDCCATQTPPNASDHVNIDQTAIQRALVGEVVFDEEAASPNPFAEENAQLTGHFVTGGDGLIKHVVNQTEGGITQTCPPEGFTTYPFNACLLFTTCQNGNCSAPSEGPVGLRTDRATRALAKR